MSTGASACIVLSATRTGLPTDLNALCMALRWFAVLLLNPKKTGGAGCASGGVWRCLPVCWTWQQPATAQQNSRCAGWVNMASCDQGLGCAVLGAVSFMLVLTGHSHLLSWHRACWLIAVCNTSHMLSVGAGAGAARRQPAAASGLARRQQAAAGAPTPAGAATAAAQQVTEPNGRHPRRCALACMELWCQQRPAERAADDYGGWGVPPAVLSHPGCAKGS